MSVSEWKRIEPTEVTKVGRRTIVTKTFRMPNGNTDKVWSVNPEGIAAAATIALTPDNKAIIVRQYRGGPEKIMDEIPGGVVDPGEDIVAAALRELHQETGYVPADPKAVEYLGFCHYDGYTNGKRHYVLVTGCVPSEKGQHDQSSLEQELEVRLVDIKTLLEISKTGRMTDPGGVLLAYDRLKELEAQ